MLLVPGMVFTILGLLLIWGMGFWNETMQTLALAVSYTHLDVYKRQQ